MKTILQARYALLYLSIFESDENGFTTGRATDDFDIANQSIEDPFALFESLKVVALKSLLLAQDEMLGADDQQGALERLLDPLDYTIVQRFVLLVTRYLAVYVYSIRQLNLNCCPI